MESLIAVANRRKYPKDGVIFFENDVGDTLFMILSGRVKVTILPDDGRESILAMLPDANFFGEMSLLDNEPRFATAIALQETEMVVRHERDFLSIVENGCAFSSTCRRAFARRTSRSETSRSTTCMGESLGFSWR